MEAYVEEDMYQWLMRWCDVAEEAVNKRIRTEREEEEREKKRLQHRQHRGEEKNSLRRGSSSRRRKNEVEDEPHVSSSTREIRFYDSDGAMSDYEDEGDSSLHHWERKSVLSSSSGEYEFHDARSHQSSSSSSRVSKKRTG